jgi:p-cumate 2,3-dioxygenase alpha subunit
MQEALVSQYVVDDRIDSRFLVSRSVFTSPEVLQLEREMIFDRCWLYVGHESELSEPNRFHTRNVAGRPVIFLRDRRGEVRVLLNTCRHRGAQVCRESSGQAKVFTCFYHGWVYDNSGKLVVVPDADAYGPGLRREHSGLVSPAKVESYRGFVFANFDPDACGLVDYLADARHLLDLVADQSETMMQVLPGTHSYSIGANWKLLAENSMDGYHGVSVHQTWLEMTANIGIAPGLVADVADRDLGRGVDLGNGHAALYGINPLGTPLMDERVRATLATRATQLVDRLGVAHATRMLQTTRNAVIFPSTVVIDVNFGILVRTMWPVAPDRTAVTAWQLVPPELDRASQTYRIENALSFWGPAGLGTPDDVEALEQCQKGFVTNKEVKWSDVSKGMVRDQPSLIDELQLRTFWRRWNQIITGESAQAEGAPYDAASYLGAG